MNYNTLQFDVPVFVRNRHKPITWKGTVYEYNKRFPWLELGVPQETVQLWFNIGMLYHNPELEKEVKLGDRLVEFEGSKLQKLYNLLNAEVKKKTNSTSEFNKYKCKHSKLEDKQRALIKSFMRTNTVSQERYQEIVEQILNEPSKVEDSTDVPQVKE